MSLRLIPLSESSAERSRSPRHRSSPSRSPLPLQCVSALTIVFQPTEGDARLAREFIYQHHDLGASGWSGDAFLNPEAGSWEALDVANLVAAVEFLRRMESVSIGRHFLRTKRVRLLRKLFNGDGVDLPMRELDRALVLTKLSAEREVKATELASLILMAMQRGRCSLGDGYIAAAMLFLRVANESTLRSQSLYSLVVGPGPDASQQWMACPDVEWVMPRPHRIFAMRKLTAKGSENYCLSNSDVWSSLSVVDYSSVQPSLVSFEGGEMAFLADTARIIMPHARHSCINDPMFHRTIFCVGQSQVGKVDVRATEPEGDIAMKELLQMILPNPVGIVCPIDARVSKAFEQSVSPHEATEFFFDGPKKHPASLFLVFVAHFGSRPRPALLEPLANVSSDFGHCCPLAILHDDGSAEPGRMFCSLDETRVLDFFTEAFEGSEIYQKYCNRLSKRIRVLVVADHDGAESIDSDWHSVHSMPG